MTRPRLVATLHLPDDGFTRGARGPAAFAEAAVREVERGADELAIFEPPGSDRRAFLLALERTSSAVRVPLLALVTLVEADEVRALLEAGADRVAPGAGVVATPSLLEACADRLGASRLVAELVARRVEGDGGPSLRTPAWARERQDLHAVPGAYEVVAPGGAGTGLSAAAWAVEAVRRGAGELLVTGEAGAIRAVRRAVLAPVAARAAGADPDQLCRLLFAGADALHLSTDADAPLSLRRALASRGVPA